MKGFWKRTIQAVTRFCAAYPGPVLLVGMVATPVIIYLIGSYTQNRICIALVLSSPQNKLAFNKYQPETDHGIYIMNADGAMECRLSWPDADDFSPVWSPDGKRIAFDTWDYNPPGNRSAIFVMDSDGTNRRMIIGWDKSYYYGRPSWSPDSNAIVFTKIALDNSSNIYIASLEAAYPPRLVTSGGFDDSRPVWSPVGKRIAFTVEARPNDVGDIYVVDIDGTNKHRLTQDGGVNPAWSPDGQHIAFAGSYTTPGLDLFVMDANGTNLHRLINDEATADRGGPSWSPDGRQIAFDNGGVWVVNLDGSGLRLLTKRDDYHVDSSPSWNGHDYTAP